MYFQKNTNFYSESSISLTNIWLSKGLQIKYITCITFKFQRESPKLGGAVQYCRHPCANSVLLIETVLGWIDLNWQLGLSGVEPTTPFSDKAACSTLFSPALPQSKNNVINVDFASLHRFRWLTPHFEGNYNIIILPWITIFV